MPFLDNGRFDLHFDRRLCSGLHRILELFVWYTSLSMFWADISESLLGLK